MWQTAPHLSNRREGRKVSCQLILEETNASHVLVKKYLSKKLCTVLFAEYWVSKIYSVALQWRSKCRFGPRWPFQRLIRALANTAMDGQSSSGEQGTSIWEKVLSEDCYLRELSRFPYLVADSETLVSFEEHFGIPTAFAAKVLCKEKNPGKP